MLVVLSPAKKLNMSSSIDAIPTTPKFSKNASELASIANTLKLTELQNLMGISENLAKLNADRFASFGNQETRPAALAFAGDTYVGLNANTLEKNDMEWAQNHLRIISGLYGLLRPLDEIEPYRLEMGSKFPIDTNNNLYEFWKEKVTGFLNEELEEGELFVNLASNEYFSSINSKNLNTDIITPQFKDFKNGKLKMISFYAKKARGMMARYLLELEEVTAENLLGFNYGSYTYSEENTTSSRAPVFIR